MKNKIEKIIRQRANALLFQKKYLQDRINNKVSKDDATDFMEHHFKSNDILGKFSLDFKKISIEAKAMQDELTAEAELQVINRTLEEYERVASKYGVDLSDLDIDGSFYFPIT